MDTYTTQSMPVPTTTLPIINADQKTTPVSEKTIEITDKKFSQNSKKELTGIEKRMLNLKKFEKGDGRPRGKRPKGSVSIKAAVDKRLKKKNANLIADKLISGAEQGENKKTEMLLKIKGELNESPTVNIQQNTLQMPIEMIEMARQYLLEKDKDRDKEMISASATTKRIVEDSPPTISHSQTLYRKIG